MGLLAILAAGAILFGGGKAVQRANEDTRNLREARKADMRAEKAKKYGWW